MNRNNPQRRRHTVIIRLLKGALALTSARFLSMIYIMSAPHPFLYQAMKSLPYFFNGIVRRGCHMLTSKRARKLVNCVNKKTSTQITTTCLLPFVCRLDSLGKFNLTLIRFCAIVIALKLIITAFCVCLWVSI